MALQWFPSDRLRTAALAALAVVAALAVIALAIIWSGLYNVAASRGHWAISERLLGFALRNSVETHSALVRMPPLDDPELIRLGAGHYELVCAGCHGSPAEPVRPVAARMLPAPPSLTDVAAHWEPAELFWIIKHGLKYTGMPGWVAPERDDEVWAMTAFVLQLRGMTPQQYRALAEGNLDATTGNPPEAGLLAAVAQCARCHGDASSGPASGLIPRIVGQRRTYLHLALDAYARGERTSGIMQPIAVALTDEERRVVAGHFAGLDRPPTADRQDAEPSDARIERGRALATSGIPEAGVPACLACHGAQGYGLFPALGGQSAAYIAAQLRLWRRGLRGETAPGAIMAVIANRLDDEQAEDVAAYFQQLRDGSAAALGGTSGSSP